MAKCNCTDGIFNSGVPSCSEDFGRVKKLVFLSYYDGSGNPNYISSSDVLDNSYFTAKINESDVNQKYFPSDVLFNIVDERGDDVVESIENVDFFVESGVRVFTGEFLNKFSSSPAYLKFLNSLKCPVVGYYAITEDNKILGDASGGAETLRPFLIQSGSIKTKFIPKTATTVSKNQLTFSLDKSMEDQYIRYSEPEEGVNLLQLNGLIDVTLESLVATSTSDFTVDGYITVNNSVKRVAYVDDISSWSVFNVTTASAVTPISITASAPYGFAFVIPAQTSGDVIRVSVSLDGYQSNVLEVTLP